ncbi:MAG: hypothetical protein GY937_17845 [bacterium]|nr:hypothetical protein [bacterium]
MRSSHSRVGPFLAAVLLLLLPVGIRGASDEPASTEWLNDDWDGMHRFISQGTIVKGHKFGFIKQQGSCDVDNLWLSWSTTQQVSDLEAVEARIQLTVATTSIQVPVELVGSAPLTPTTTVVAFSNFAAGEELVKLLSNGGEVVVKLAGPEELVSRFEVLEDRFALGGFAASREAAEAACQRDREGSEASADAREGVDR